VCEVLRKQSGRSITADEETKEPEDKELPIEIPPINYTASILMLPVAASEPEQPLPKVRVSLLKNHSIRQLALPRVANRCLYEEVIVISYLSSGVESGPLLTSCLPSEIPLFTCVR